VSDAPLATYRVFRRKVLELTRPSGHAGAIVELFHWFGRADVSPMISGPNSLEKAEYQDWNVQSWRRPRYLLTPGTTHLDIRAGYQSGVMMRVRIWPLSTARPLERTASGRVADVVAYDGPAVTATVSFRSASIFAGDPDGRNSRLMLAEGGLHRGPLPIPAGPALLSIETDRPWTIELP
jgi:hypothetical protein